MLEKSFGLSTDIQNRFLPPNLINLCKVHPSFDYCKLSYYKTLQNYNHLYTTRYQTIRRGEHHQHILFHQILRNILMILSK